MSLINCEINLILSWFAITETKVHVPVVTLSTRDNAELLMQLKSGFKRTINQNKYISKPELLAQNPNLNHLVEPSFQGKNRLFGLAFKNDVQSTGNKKYCLPNVEIDDYNVMIDGRNFFVQPVKNNKIRYENIRYETGCLLDYLYFNKNYKMIAKDLSKQHELDADPKAIQQINFTANLDRAGNKTIFFILEEEKETVLDFSQRPVKVLQNSNE